MAGTVSSGEHGRTRSPVLIIGTERSGSNVLRLMLDCHPNIAVPHPPHFMRYLAPLAASYGDLTKDANRRRLVRDAVSLLRAHIYPWDCRIDIDLVVRESRPTVFGVTAAIYEQYRRATGKPRWGCKSTFMVDHVSDALAEYPGTRLILLVRDPLDVAASMRQSVFGPCQPRLSAELWRCQQQKALTAVQRWGAEKIRTVRYEDLVVNPRHELDGIVRHIGEEFDERMVHHYESAASHRLSRMCESWHRAGLPVSADRIGSYQDVLSENERQQVLHITGDLRSEFGYAPLAATPVRPSPYFFFRLQDFGLRAVVEYRSFRNDLNWWRRWRRDARVRWIALRASCRSVVRKVGERHVWQKQLQSR